jgi:hypothetical protein
MITIKSKNDISATKALIQYNLRKLKIILPVFGLLFAALGVADFIIEGEIFMFFLCAFGGIIIALSPFVIPLLIVKQVAKNKFIGGNIINEYTFTDTGDLRIETTRDGAQFGVLYLKRSDIIKFAETGEYLFIHISGQQAFIIKKEDAGETAVQYIKGLYTKTNGL